MTKTVHIVYRKFLAFDHKKVSAWLLFSNLGLGPKVRGVPKGPKLNDQ